MCGIVGHVTCHDLQPDCAAVREAMRRLAHRGPDGEGMAVMGQACLGHRRLSIIDLQGSAQPWCSGDGRHTLVFNGEIYNYLELRAELQKAGHCFRSSGDTEVLLELFIRHGEACLQMINGMFAFAVWDDKKRMLFVARDRLGKKPLYYALSENSLAFASEIHALRAFAHVDTGLDFEAVHDYFAYQFVPGEKTIHLGIRKLPPGHYLRFQGGRCDISRYWAPPRPTAGVRQVASLGEELTALIDHSVKLRLRSDVPLGVFLSGGIDSAIIASSVRRQGIEVDAFTVGFGEESYDEREPAADTAAYLGVRHHTQVMHVEFEHILTDWLRVLGEPFADPSAVPAWYVCRHARDHVVVALSGDGGDELFAGYRRYRARQLLVGFERLPEPAKELLAVMTSVLPESDRYFARSPVKMLKLFMQMRERLAASPQDLLPQTFSFAERQLLFGGRISVPDRNHIEQFGLHDLDPVTQMQLVDLQMYLAEDILTKVDRMSMAHGLEVRSPLLDYRVVEFASRLPLEWKIRGGVQKWILREAFRERLPSNLLRRRKQGFAVPLASWFRGHLRKLFEGACLESLPEFIERGYVHKLWQEHQRRRADHGFKLWTLLVFCLWYRETMRA